VRRRQDEAYVVDTSEMGEADLIVTLVAENAGRVRGVAPSARRSRKRFGGALEPLTRVRASWVEREGRDLHRIESLEPARSYAAMQSEPARQAACAVLAEVAAATAREEQPDPTAFRLVGAVLDALEGGLDPFTAIRYFEFWELKLHGVLPELSGCGSCGRALPSTSTAYVAPGDGLRCAACERQAPGAKRLTRADRAFLEAAATSPPAAMAAHARAARPGGALESLLRGALEVFAEKRFRTYRHLAAAVAP
jgi:DNA repair protein RecO (recombination protein O)